MLSRSSEYALTALIDLARHCHNGPVSRDQIAERTNIPARYLSKILSDLVHTGILTSTRGPGGGFILSRAADRISLFEVISPYETLEQKRCPFGNKECSDENPCLAHHEWKKVLQSQRAFFHHTSLSDVAVAEVEQSAG